MCQDRHLGIEFDDGDVGVIHTYWVSMIEKFRREPTVEAKYLNTKGPELKIFEEITRGLSNGEAAQAWHTYCQEMERDFKQFSYFSMGLSCMQHSLALVAACIQE